MSKYNRENPFMYLVESKHSEFESKCTIAVRSMIIMGILSFVALIGCIVKNILTYQWILSTEIFMITLITLFMFKVTIHSVSLVKKGNLELNDIIFSDKYQNINVNNEKLLNDNNFLNNCIGKIEFIIEGIQICKLMYTILIVYYLLNIIGHLL
jgi:hypothetical protein